MHSLARVPDCTCWKLFSLGATSCFPVDAGCILMAWLVNRLSNCTPRTDNPGHTINTMLRVVQCSTKVERNAIETWHTVQCKGILNGGIQCNRILNWGIQLTRPAEIALVFPRLEPAALGAQCRSSKCLMPQNINCHHQFHQYYQ